MRSTPQQQPQSPSTAPQQRPGDPYPGYDPYNRQAVSQQESSSSYQQDSYANPQRQQSDPRLYPPPPEQQRPTASADRAEPYPDRAAQNDQHFSGGAYGQPPGSRRAPEPYGNSQQGMSSDTQGPEFGMGRRGAGQYGRGPGQNPSRGQTPPPAQGTLGNQGTGAASVLALGQNKLPQRAEVLLHSTVFTCCFLMCRRKLCNCHACDC